MPNADAPPSASARPVLRVRPPRPGPPPAPRVRPPRTAHPPPALHRPPRPARPPAPRVRPPAPPSASACTARPPPAQHRASARLHRASARPAPRWAGAGVRRGRGRAREARPARACGAGAGGRERCARRGLCLLLRSLERKLLLRSLALFGRSSESELKQDRCYRVVRTPESWDSSQKVLTEGKEAFIECAVRLLRCSVRGVVVALWSRRRAGCR
jgi:hypothetical protein